MKKINMKQFDVSVRLPDGTTKDINYAIKESMVEILFNPALKLKTIDLLRQEVISKKIIEAGDELLLEEEEYNRLKSAMDVVEGLSKNDLEMVHRINDAETIEVKPVVS
jgi:hypothetical protein